MNKVLILGAYGNFGKRIAAALTKKNIPLVLGGRNNKKLNSLEKELRTINSNTSISTTRLDIKQNLQESLARTNPNIVINTCGPFQNQDYFVATQCINNKAHYIDLSDGRNFVTGIKELDTIAKLNNVVVISGASTVPALSSAVIEKFSNHFSEMNLLQYGISPGQKTPRGLATTKAILSYVGRPISIPCSITTHYGWQDTYCQKYPSIGKRWMSNCDIPDLDLFPTHYQIKSIKFSAGLENPILHFGLCLLSWLIRIGIPLDLPKYSDSFLKISDCFNLFGTDDGGMHVIIHGKDHHGNNIKLQWYIIAKNGDGPQIPTIPAIILTEKLIKGNLKIRGAMPCVGLVSLNEYLNELKNYCIKIHSNLS